MYVSARLMKVARATDSPALAADAWHLRTDVMTSLGVLIGIITIKITGLYIIDPIIAMVVAFLILKAAFDLLRESVGSILDARLPDHEEKAIREILHSYKGRYVDYKKLRTRKAGAQRHIDFTLVVPRGKQILSTHFLCDSIEKDLSEHIPELEVVIHAEPCDPENGDCKTCQVKISYYLTRDETGLCNECENCYPNTEDEENRD